MFRTSNMIVDFTIVRAHQHAAGAKKGSEDQAIAPLAAMASRK